ncbi:MAG: MFS transporter [Alphaproteobacteria bacterium]
MTAILPLIPLYLGELGVTDPVAVKSWTAILGSAPFAVAVIFTPIWGSLSDRFGYKAMVVRSIFGIAIAAIGMGLATAPGQLLFWRLVQGAVSGVFPAAVALVSARTPEVRVGRALAILQSARAGGALLGPLVGGILADAIGIHSLFGGVGAIAIATALLCAFGIEREPPSAHAHAAAANTTSSRDLLSDRGVLGMLVLIALFQVVVMTPWPSLALFVQLFDTHERTVATTTGLLVFATGLPSLLATTWWARLGARRGLVRMTAISLAAVGALNVCTGLVAKRIEAVFALRALTVFAMAGVIPLSFEWISRRAPDGARGRMAGLGSTAMMLGNVIGPTLGGWLSVNLGLPATFWAPGAVAAIAGAALALANVLREE